MDLACVKYDEEFKAVVEGPEGKKLFEDNKVWKWFQALKHFTAQWSIFGKLFSGFENNVLFNSFYWQIDFFQSFHKLFIEPDSMLSFS